MKRWLNVGLTIILTSFIILIIVISLTSPPPRALKTVSKNFAELISSETVDYIHETGEVPPLDSRLSQILMGKNRLNIQFVNLPRGNPIGKVIDKKGFFIDDYKHPLSVEIKGDEVIVKNSAGEVLATSNIRDGTSTF